MNRISALLLAASSLGMVAADWPSFRGPAGNGSAPPVAIPARFGFLPAKAAQGEEKKPKAVRTQGIEENVAWKKPLPGRGLSGPVVVDGKVIVTASSGARQDRLHVLSFDAKTGKELWHRQLWSTGRTACHPKTCMAAPTPASDGKIVVAFYSTNDVACFDLDGNLLWFRGLGRDYPNAGNSVGMASSPLIVGDRVILQVESQGDSFAVGLDAADGRNVWKMNRPRDANWTSPVLFPGEPTTVLLQGTDGLHGVDPAEGKVRWSYAKGCSSIPSSAVAGDMICVPSGGLTALKIEPGKKEPTVLWTSNRLGPQTASPLIHEGRVYVIGSGSILKCGDLSTGELLWQLRLKGPHSSSPIASGKTLLCFNEEGQGQVVDLSGKEGKLDIGGELDETILCTPAVAEGALFVRSDAYLWKISRAPAVARARLTFSPKIPGLTCGEKTDSRPALAVNFELAGEPAGRKSRRIP